MGFHPYIMKQSKHNRFHGFVQAKLRKVSLFCKVFFLFFGGGHIDWTLYMIEVSKTERYVISSNNSYLFYK